MIYRLSSLLLIIISCLTPALGEFTLSDTSAYLGIFIVDYTDTTFEGGDVQKLTPCISNDSLPLRMEYVEPSDFGSVTFRYTLTSEIVFTGGIVWMGTGRITKPDPLVPPDSFPVADDSVSLPSAIKYYYQGSLTSMPDIDCAWNKIHRLKVVTDLMDRKCHVGLYLYPPTVGAFDPDAAKIIVFIFRNAGTDAHVKCGYSHNKQVHSLSGKALRWNRNTGEGRAMRMVTGNSSIVDLQGRVVRQMRNVSDSRLSTGSLRQAQRPVDKLP
jgi:hypothetical protein